MDTESREQRRRTGVFEENFPAGGERQFILNRVLTKKGKYEAQKVDMG